MPEMWDFPSYLHPHYERPIVLPLLTPYRSAPSPSAPFDWYDLALFRAPQPPTGAERYVEVFYRCGHRAAVLPWGHELIAEYESLLCGKSGCKEAEIFPYRSGAVEER